MLAFNDKYLGARFSLREGLTLHVFYMAGFDRSRNIVILSPANGGGRQEVDATLFEAGLMAGSIEVM